MSPLILECPLPRYLSITTTLGLHNMAQSELFNTLTSHLSLSGFHVSHTYLQPCMPFSAGHGYISVPTGGRERGLEGRWLSFQLLMLCPTLLRWVKHSSVDLRCVERPQKKIYPVLTPH